MEDDIICSLVSKFGGLLIIFSDKFVIDDKTQVFV
jgi:hypothetical protein